MRYIVAIGLATILGGCLPQAEAPTASPAASPTATAPAESPIASSTAASPSPTTRTETISIEGESTQVTLKPYESPDFATAVPDDFTARPGASDEARDVVFYFTPTGTIDETAYVQISFPSGSSSVEALTAAVTEDLTRNNSEILDRSDSPSYRWAETAIEYQRPGEDGITGTYYIGEHQGKAFLVLTHYPIEYAEGFLPRADLILENLELR